MLDSAQFDGFPYITARRQRNRQAPQSGVRGLAFAGAKGTLATAPFRFDRLARAAGAAESRRGVLSAALAGIAGAALASLAGASPPPGSGGALSGGTGRTAGRIAAGTNRWVHSALRTPTAAARPCASPAEPAFGTASRCGDNAGCANGEVCFDGLCFLGGGGAGELPLFGWGGGACAFATGGGFCLFVEPRRETMFGAVRRYRDGRARKIDAQNKGVCEVCTPAFNIGCRPQVMPTDWQVRQHCQDVREFAVVQSMQVDCVQADCDAGEEAIRTEQHGFYECRSTS